jgi:hypothetical protein
MDSLSPGAAIERRFFTIVRWFGLMVTSITLAIAVAAAASGLFKLLPQTSSGIHTPKAAYDDFRRTTDALSTDNSQKSADTTLKQKEVAAANAAAEADFERSLKPHLDAILGNLVNYAVKIDQAKPSAQAVGDYVRSNMQQVWRSTRDDAAEWGYVQGLETATHDLAADAERLSKLDSGNPSRVRWDTFLDWFTRQYNQQINADLQRINMERAQAIANAAEAPGFFYAGAVAFGIFIFATLLLLLLRIELNTRQT